MTVKRPSIASPTLISLKGTPVPGAEDRQSRVPGFDQEKFSRAHVLCIGAGGIISNIAPTLCRKGIGKVTLLDHDTVEASNLNRQRFYTKDLGEYKAIALAQNLVPECIAATEIRGIPLRLEDAIAAGLELRCDVVACGVDNNPARVLAGRYFRKLGVPVVFCGVSADADHGYVFVQDQRGAVIADFFPDIENDDRHLCPGTPAIADILQVVGAMAAYGIDSLLTSRSRTWTYRRIELSDSTLGASASAVMS